MINSTKYAIVIGALVILGGIGVYGLRSMQDNSIPTAVAVTSTATPKAAPTDPTTSSASADVAAQNAEFSSEATDTPGSVESASPTDDPTSTDTTATDSVLNNE